MGKPVRFGVFVPQGWRLDLTEIDDPVEQFEAMTAVAKVADAEPNIDSIWVYDHLHTTPTPELETTFECWTISATLARDTERVNIGQMVGCNGYRHPALYAKIASTVDVASHGRLYAGIGAGWYEHEWRAYGFGGPNASGVEPGDFPDVPTRMRMFREAVEIIHKLWTEERPSFSGRYYAIDRPINLPMGARKPHIPLWIGGGGEQVTLKLVAKYASACNVGGGNAEMVRHKLGVLERHCDDEGRDFDEIIKSTSVSAFLLENEADAERETAAARGDQSLEEYGQNTWVVTPEQMAERLRPVINAGADYIICYLPRVAYDATPVQRLAREVVPLIT